jgi:hypothetical protein
LISKRRFDHLQNPDMVRGLGRCITEKPMSLERLTKATLNPKPDPSNILWRCYVETGSMAILRFGAAEIGRPIHESHVAYRFTAATSKG